MKISVICILLILFGVTIITIGGFVTSVEAADPPLVTINFAGNLNDTGGPYWNPPYEATQLAGVWSDGYYANDSGQQEDFIYVNTTITGSPTDVWLNLYDKTGNIWVNWTYALTNCSGNYWEINLSGNHTNYDQYNYDNLRHNDVSGNDFAPISNTLLWKINVSGNNDNFGGASIHDGIVYFSPKEANRNLSAIYLNNGTIKWNYSHTGGGYTDSTSTYHNGIVYISVVNSTSRFLLAVYSNNGTEKWKSIITPPYNGATFGSSIIDEDNNQILVCAVGNLFAIYLNNGTIKWIDTSNSASSGWTSPTLYNNIVYWLSSDNTAGDEDMFATYASNGTTKWSKTQGAFNSVFWDSSPVLNTTGNLLYIGHKLGNDYVARAVNMSTGGMVWNSTDTDLDVGVYATPAFDGKYLYVVADGILYKIDGSNGVSVYSIEFDTNNEQVYSSPILSNGYLYTGSNNDTFYCFDASDGSTEWEYDLTTVIYGQPAIADGILVFPADDWYLYALGNLSQYNKTITFNYDSDYSFDIVANNTDGSNITTWNKTGIGGGSTRRYVQLSCPTENISYQLLYVTTKEETFGPGVDTDKKDRLHRDQGTNGTVNDTGYLRTTVPTDSITQLYCIAYAGLWYDEDITIEPFVLDNIYFHFWMTQRFIDIDKIGYVKTREQVDVNDPTESYLFNSSTENRSQIYHNAKYNEYDRYNLTTHLLEITNTSFTDNNIFELLVKFKTTDWPEMISNRSFNSFVILNVPPNATLLGMDTDSDNLNDYEELFITYTNPRLPDTDADGINDYWENLSGSDPNNWTETYNITITSVIYVDDDRPAGWYNSTQVATVDWGVANVSNGGTVYIWDGTYTINANVFPANFIPVYKNISIIGNSSNSVHINANHKTIFYLNGSASDPPTVNISELHLYNTDNEPLIDVEGGVRHYFHNLSLNCTIGSHISWQGIKLNDGDNHTIENCNFSDFNDSAVYVAVPDVVIENCSFEEGIGATFPAYPMEIREDRVVIRNCSFKNYETIMYTIGNNITITSNTFMGSFIAIILAFSPDCLIYNNIFYANVTTYVWIAVCPRLKLNISMTLGTNILGGKFLGGNSWGNYTGTSPGNTGIGNISFLVGSWTDYLPLTTNTTYILPNTPNITAINKVSATLDTHLSYDYDENTYTGFWIGRSPTSSASFDQNVTCTGTYSEDDVFTKSVSGLTSGDYYYVRSWMMNQYGFWNSSAEGYFLTKPAAPTGFTVENVSYTSITFSWTNATAGANTNTSTVIVYKTGSYPTTPFDGTEGYNGTAESATIGGLSVDTTYYFGAWTYLNASGSPFFSWMSDGFGTGTGSTIGGVYNITIRWEDNLSIVNSSTLCWNASSFWALATNGSMMNLTQPPDMQAVDNPFSVNASFAADRFIFDYCGLGMDRVVMPASGERNVTIYVTPRPEYNSSYEDDINATQIRYTFSFEDYTNYFQGSTEAKLYVYKYNGTQKYYIHQDYWSVEKTVDVSLQYGDRYLIGVSCPDLTIDFLQYFDALAELDPTIQIVYPESTGDPIETYVTINTSWDATGLWINYTDSSFSTVNVTINIYDITNVTEDAIWRNRTNFSTDTNDYHWLIAVGCNLSNDYRFVIEINNSLFTTNQTMYAYLYNLYDPVVSNPNWIENLINKTLGESPIQGEGGMVGGEYVPWLHIIAFGACMLILVTFGEKHGSTALIATGFMVIIVEVILGIVITRSVGFTTVGILGGMLMVILGVLAEMGGRD